MGASSWGKVLLGPLIPKISDMVESMKPPKPPAPPTAPTLLSAATGETIQDTAAVDAKKVVENKRRTLLASGGVTNITAGSGAILSGQTSAPTLLGG